MGTDLESHACYFYCKVKIYVVIDNRCPLVYRRLNIIFTIIRDAATSVEVSFGYATLVYMPWRRGATREETRSRIAIWPRQLLPLADRRVSSIYIYLR